MFRKLIYSFILLSANIHLKTKINVKKSCFQNLHDILRKSTYKQILISIVCSENKGVSLPFIRNDTNASEKRFIKLYIISPWHVAGSILSTGATSVNKRKNKTTDKNSHPLTGYSLAAREGHCQQWI